MYPLLQCIAEAVVEKGVRGLAAMIPLGAVLYDIAECAWLKYRSRYKDNQQQRDIELLAGLTIREARCAAMEAAKLATRGKMSASSEDKENLERFLARIPESIRAAFQRPEDRTGKTVPAGFELVSSDDLMQLLPRFRPGIPLPDDEHWILQRQLGTGGFGEVWLVRNRDSDQLFGAVKFFRNLRSRNADLQGEANQVIDVSKRNPASIVQVRGIHLTGDTPWILFEYVAGGDLQDFIAKLKGMPIEKRRKQTLAALKQLARAAGQFHRHDPPIVHRDLKPANILFDPNTKKLKIIDFGIAGIASRHGTATRQVNGAYSFLYAPIQQRNGEAPDPRDDIHALGVIAYQMLTGRWDLGIGPDFAEDLAHEGIEPTLIDLIGRCTAQSMDRRPKDGGELAERLDRLPRYVPTDIRRDEQDYLESLKAGKLSVFLTSAGDKTIARWKEYAEEGIALTCHLYGECLKWGCGMERNDAAAEKWFRQAAEDGYAPAQFRLGWMAKEGLAMAKNDVEAEKWLRKAAVQGLALAQYHLAMMYQEGRGVTKCDAIAKEWFVQAAQQGEQNAQLRLGRFFRDNQEMSKYEYDQQAFDWFSKAAQAGNAEAQNDLGLMCDRLDSTSAKRNPNASSPKNNAFGWIQKAAKQGIPEAQYNLGWMYYSGHGVEKCEAEALTWLGKAADQGIQVAVTAIECIGKNKNRLNRIWPKRLPPRLWSDGASYV